MSNLDGSKTNLEGIYHFWIIHRDSGLTMFSQEFLGLKTRVDSDIVGGYLVALMSFAHDMANQDIDFVQMSQMRISYCIREKFVMVVITSNSANVDRIRKMLDIVQQRFESEYHDILNRDFSDVSKFQSFAKITEKIFEAETRYLTIIKSRAESLEDYFNEASKEWKELHEKLIEHSYSIGQWGNSNIFKINANIQKDLVQARKNAIQRNLEKKEKMESKLVGSWI